MILMANIQYQIKKVSEDTTSKVNSGQSNYQGFGKDCILKNFHVF